MPVAKRTQVSTQWRSNVGASLLAMAVGQSTLMLNVIPSSRASRIAAPPLPLDLLRFTDRPVDRPPSLGDLLKIAIEQVTVAAIGHRVQ